jgi:hypothetical protein
MGRESGKPSGARSRPTAASFLLVPAINGRRRHHQLPRPCLGGECGAPKVDELRRWQEIFGAAYTLAAIAVFWRQTSAKVD